MTSHDDESPNAAPRAPVDASRAAARGTDLPTSYGRTKIVLMAIDPFHVHAYWEVTERDRLATMKRLDPLGAHQLSWVLRFHDVTSNEVGRDDAHFDVFVDRAARNWYVELWAPNKRYWVELGTSFGPRFAPVSRSNVVELPRIDRAPVPSPRGTSESTLQVGGGEHGQSGGMKAPSSQSARGAEPSSSGEAFRANPERASRVGSPEPRHSGPTASQVLTAPEDDPRRDPGVVSRSTSLDSDIASGSGSSGMQTTRVRLKGGSSA